MKCIRVVLLIIILLAILGNTASAQTLPKISVGSGDPTGTEAIKRSFF